MDVKKASIHTVTYYCITVTSLESLYKLMAVITCKLLYLFTFNQFCLGLMTLIITDKWRKGGGKKFDQTKYSNEVQGKDQIFKSINPRFSKYRAQRVLKKLLFLFYWKGVLLISMNPGTCKTWLGFKILSAWKDAFKASNYA